MTMATKRIPGTADVRIAVTVKDDAHAEFNGPTAGYSISVRLKVPTREGVVEHGFSFACGTDSEDARSLVSRLKKDKSAELIAVSLAPPNLEVTHLRIDGVEYELS
jgi:hypothetical protein